MKKGEVIGEVKLTGKTYLVVANSDIGDRLDIRIWVASERYRGPTKKGINIPKEVIPELVEILSKVKLNER